MTRFLCALLIYGLGLYALGQGLLETDRSDASFVWKGKVYGPFAYCMRPTPAKPFPHFIHTRKKCGSPGLWVRV